MKVLVTGGAGFIGSNIVDALIAKNHQVLILDNISTGKRQNLNPQAKLYELDLTSAAAAEMIVNEKPEIVFHLGAQIDVRKSIAEPEFDRKINVGGSKNLLDAAETAGVKKFIFSSTGGAIYGETNILPSPETTPNNPLSQYGKSKLEVDREMESRSRAGSKMVMVSLRYGNVFGPRQDPLGEAGVISIFGNGLLKGKPIFINGDGKQTRDYVFVGDVVQANLLAMEKCEQHQIFNVGTGVETNVLQIVDLLKEMINPANPQVSHRSAIAGEVLRSVLDASKIKQQLGWQPQVSLAQGMQKFVEWLKAQG